MDPVLRDPSLCETAHKSGQERSWAAKVKVCFRDRCILGQSIDSDVAIVVEVNASLVSNMRIAIKDCRSKRLPIFGDVAYVRYRRMDPPVLGTMDVMNRKVMAAVCDRLQHADHQ